MGKGALSHAVRWLLTPSLLAGTWVTPVGPFTHHPWLHFGGHPGVALGVPGTGQGAMLRPPHAPLPAPLPGCPPRPCTPLPITVPGSVGRHDAVQPVWSKGRSP